MKHILKILREHSLIKEKAFFKKMGYDKVDLLGADYIVDHITPAGLVVDYPKALETLDFYKRLLVVFVLVLENPEDPRISHRTFEEWSDKFKNRLDPSHIQESALSDAIDALTELESYVANKIEEYKVPENVQLPLEEVEDFSNEDSEDLTNLFADLEDTSDLERSKEQRRAYQKTQEENALEEAEKELRETLPEQEELSDLFKAAVEEEENLQQVDQVTEVEDDPLIAEKVMQELLLTPNTAKRKIFVAQARKHPKPF
jgi:hypothetical protein